MSGTSEDKAWQRRIKIATAKYLLGKVGQNKLNQLFKEYEQWKENTRG